jgi:geranylgeranyl reductase family protein
MTTTTDVIIVGGGPAGAATAIALRRRGVEVLLFDRANFPRDKVCGDVLLPEAQVALRALGLDLCKLQWSAYSCTGARYVGLGSHIEGAFRDASGELAPWWMIRRRDFDEWLLAQAARAGALVVEGIIVDGVMREGDAVCGVTIRGRDGTPQQIRSRVVIGADGASSVVARAVGAFDRDPQHTCLAGRAYVSGVSLPQPYLEVFTTPRTLPGCAWIVPTGPSEANVGIGIVQSTADQLSCTPQSLFDELRRDEPVLHERLRGAGDIKLTGWMLPSATEQRRIAGPGWLLVGDAGAMVDPFTGHGIHNAIAAARIAGDVIADALREAGVGSLIDYERQCRDTFSHEIERGRILQRLHARPTVMRAALEACSRHDGLRSTFLSLVGHTGPRQSLLDPAALIRTALTFRRAGAAA